MFSLSISIISGNTVMLLSTLAGSNDARRLIISNKMSFIYEYVKKQPYLCLLGSICIGQRSVRGASNGKMVVCVPSSSEGALGRVRQGQGTLPETDNSGGGHSERNPAAKASSGCFPRAL